MCVNTRYLGLTEANRWIHKARFPLGPSGFPATVLALHQDGYLSFFSVEILLSWNIIMIEKE